MTAERAAERISKVRHRQFAGYIQRQRVPDDAPADELEDLFALPAYSKD